MNITALNHSSEDEQAGRDGPNRDPEQEAADEGSTVLMFLVLIVKDYRLSRRRGRKRRRRREEDENEDKEEDEEKEKGAEKRRGR